MAMSKPCNTLILHRISEGVDLISLKVFAEMMRILVRTSRLKLAQGCDLFVTVSMGATIARASDTTQSLVARADDLMYEAKAKGKDSVVDG